MFGHYIKSALRSLRRDRQFGVINILGLSVALTAAILILLFIRDELSYDDWGPETPNLYRLEGSLFNQDGTTEHTAVSPGRMRDPLANDFSSDIRAISRLYNEGHLFKRENEAFIDTVSYVDPGFFEIFDLPLVTGTREAVFADNSSILLTEEMAIKYFGDSDPVGQILDPDDTDYSFRVVGVLKDLPEHTHLDFDFVAMFDPARYVDRPWVATYWQSHNVYTYMKLSPTSDAAQIERELPAFIDRNVVAAETPGIVEPLSTRLKMRLMPVSDIHLKSIVRFQMKQGGDMRLVVSFGIIAGLIIFIACVNFVNLSTARASLRTREIALRKVVGAQRRQLVAQFLLETSLAVGLALLLALVLVEVTLPWFSDFISKILSLNLMNDPVAILMVAGLLVVVGLGAGLHPAFHITRVRPARVLHSSGAANLQGGKLRAGLVMLQFAISIGLMIVTFVVKTQTDYARDKDLGFDIENRLRLSYMSYKDVEPVAETLREEIARLPGVADVAFSNRPLPLGGRWGFSFQKDGDPSQATYNLEDVPVDYESLDFINAKLIAGRMFDRNRALDKTHASAGDTGVTEVPTIINRYAVGYLGYASPEEAVGESFSYTEVGEKKRLTIIGVVEDMHMRSLRDQMEPLQFSIPDQAPTTLNIRVAGAQAEETRRAIELVWKRHVPDFPVNLTSFEENFGQFYAADRQRGEIFGVFAMFAVFVSSIGLFSQAAYTAQRRSKEIGIRKLMGASTFAVVRLMVWQFSKPVLVANLIAWPTAWLITQDWLSGFAYRIDLTPVPFVVASTLAFAIAAVTIVYHAFRASNTNPAVILKHE